MFYSNYSFRVILKLKQKLFPNIFIQPNENNSIFETNFDFTSDSLQYSFPFFENLEQNYSMVPDHIDEEQIQISSVNLFKTNHFFINEFDSQTKSIKSSRKNSISSSENSSFFVNFHVI